MTGRLRILLTHLLVTHLAFGPVLSSNALAAEESGEGEPKFQEHIVESPSSGLQQAGSIIQGLGNQMMEMQRQQGQYAQQASTMAKLQPKTHPSKLFPQCQMPFASPTFPKNACNSPPQDKQQMTMQQTYQQASARYEKFYDQMMSTATNTQTAGGLQCLRNARNNTMANLNQQINSLQSLSDRIKKENQKFRDNAQEILDKIKDSHGLLHGGAGSENIDARAANINDLFSPTCRNVIATAAEGDTTQAASAIIRGRGLLGRQGNDGARALVSKVRNKGNNFRSNKNAIISDINQYLDNIKGEIQESGVAGLESGGDLGRALQETGLTSFRGGQGKGRITSTIQKEYSELAEYKQEVQEEINNSDLDYEIPRMDNNFGVDFEHFEANAENFFRKQYVNDCVTGEGSTGIGLDSKEIMSSLSSSRVSNDNYIVNKYKNALQNILESDQYIEDKLAQIRALDKEYQNGSIKITYQNNQSQRTKQTPYNYYQNIVQSCNQRYEQDDTFTDSSKGVSAKKKVGRVKQQLKELKNRHQDFANNLVSEISDSLIRCNGAQLKQGVNSCSSDVFEPSSSKFCVEHAQQCSNRINQCYGEVQDVVTKEKQKMKAQSQAFNQQVESFVANQERILKNVKGRIKETQEMLKSFFPGANYNLAKDLFIEMPGKKNASMLGKDIGIKLRGGGEDFLKNLEQLPQKISKLKKQLNQQKGQVDDVIKNHMNEQKTAMQRNKRKWEELHNSCQRSIASFRQQKQKQFQNQQENFQKKKQALSRFCDRFNSLHSYGRNPGPACDGEIDSLMKAVRGSGELGEAAPHISGQAKSLVYKYKSMCHTIQSESPSLGDSSSDDDGPFYDRICEDDQLAEEMEGKTKIGDLEQDEIKEKLLSICQETNEHKEDCLKKLSDKGIIEDEDADLDREEIQNQISELNDEIESVRRTQPHVGLENRDERISELENQIAELEEKKNSTSSIDDGQNVNFCDIKKLEARLLSITDDGDPSGEKYLEEESFDLLTVTNLVNDELKDMLEDDQESATAQASRTWQELGEMNSNASCQSIAGQQRSTGNPMLDGFQEAFGGRDPAGSDTIFR